MSSRGRRSARSCRWVFLKTLFSSLVLRSAADLLHVTESGSNHLTLTLTLTQAAQFPEFEGKPDLLLHHGSS